MVIHFVSFRSLYRSTLASKLEFVVGRSAFLDACGERSVLAIKKITVSEALPHHQQPSRLSCTVLSLDPMQRKRMVSKRLPRPCESPVSYVVEKEPPSPPSRPFPGGVTPQT